MYAGLDILLLILSEISINENSFSWRAARIYLLNTDEFY
jgi:hypothetical protein